MVCNLPSGVVYPLVCAGVIAQLRTCRSALAATGSCTAGKFCRSMADVRGEIFGRPHWDRNSLVAEFPPCRHERRCSLSSFNKLTSALKIMEHGSIMLVTVRQCKSKPHGEETVPFHPCTHMQQCRPWWQQEPICKSGVTL